MIKLLFTTIIILLNSSILVSEISYDSCWSLLKRGEYDQLSNNLLNEDFQTYFFRAKINRQKQEFEEGIKNIQKALSFFRSDDVSKEYADAMEEYSVLARQSMYDYEIAVDALRKSISIRKMLGDSTRLATAYLYMGNTYIVYDDKPGNIDSTLKYYSLASDYYTTDDIYSNAMLEHNMGVLYSEQGDHEAALNAYIKSGNLFKSKGYTYDYLLAELGIVDISLTLNDADQADKTLSVISKNDFLDSFPDLKKSVLISYIDLYKMQGQHEQAVLLYDSLKGINHDIFNAQQQEANAKYNNERLELQLAREELLSQKRRTTITYLGLSLGLIGIAFLAYTYIQRQRKILKEQQLLLEKQEALQAERNRIAAEMHDDLGGGLTTIKFVSQSAMRSADNDRDKDRLQKIVNQSNKLVSNMSEIIWAMNSKFDTLESTVAYIRRYTTTFLSDNQLRDKIIVDGDMNNVPLSSTERRNVLLVIKEALNNIVKHAAADLVTIKVKYEKSILLIDIVDDGVGFFQENTVGNGLANMEDRISNIGGRIEFLNPSVGSHLYISLPLK